MFALYTGSRFYLFWDFLPVCPRGLPRGHFFRVTNQILPADIPVDSLHRLVTGGHGFNHGSRTGDGITCGKYMGNTRLQDVGVHPDGVS